MASECQTDSLCRQAGELTGDGDQALGMLHVLSGITVDAGIESIISNDIFTGVGKRFG